MPPGKAPRPRLFMEADVLFAGAASSNEHSASLLILRLAEITLLEAVTSQQVITEVERNLDAAEALGRESGRRRALVAVSGAGGRMGRTLIQAVNEQSGLVLGAASERPGSSTTWIRSSPAESGAVTRRQMQRPFSQSLTAPFAPNSSARALRKPE